MRAHRGHLDSRWPGQRALRGLLLPNLQPHQATHVFEAYHCIPAYDRAISKRVALTPTPFGVLRSELPYRVKYSTSRYLIKQAAEFRTAYSAIPLRSNSFVSPHFSLGGAASPIQQHTVAYRSRDGLCHF